MKKANPNTHLACRSLLQKAVRRGFPKLAERVIEHLYAAGDSRWLKGRVGVIIAEECWPEFANWCLAKKNRTGDREQIDSIIAELSAIATRRKYKDAAGLGTLAYALSQGDDSVLTGGCEDMHIKAVSEGIGKKQVFNKYWNHMLLHAPEKCGDDTFVRHAKDAFHKAGWPWDRAFAQAAAYLAVTKGVPTAKEVTEEQDLNEFPFYIALDKHTPEGKSALRNVSRKLQIPYLRLNWVSFYCESGVVDSRVPSYWWKREVEWRLERNSLSPKEALSLWAEVRPHFVSALKQNADFLKKHVLDDASPCYRTESFIL